MRTKVLAAAITVAMGAAASVQAAPISLPGGSPIYFQFNNLEQVSGSNSIVVPGGAIDVNGDGVVDTPATEGNWGGFNLSSIQNGGIATPNSDISGGDAFFVDDGTADGFGQGQVSGVFYGITITGETTATGGWIDLYWEDPADDDISSADLNGDYAPTNRTSANQFGKFTDGTFLARLAFMPGIIPGDGTTTIQSDTNPATQGASGQSDSFADVIDINNDGVIDSADGVWASVLNGDWFFVDVDGDGIFGEEGERRDLRFSTFFNGLATWDGGGDIFGLRSNDPGRVFTVPEPGVLGILGAALLGLGFSSRRRNKKA